MSVSSVALGLSLATTQKGLTRLTDEGLAATSLTTSPLLPELQTLNGSGVKGYEVNTWFGFVAPAGTPPAIVDKLRGEIVKILANPGGPRQARRAGFRAVASEIAG